MAEYNKTYSRINWENEPSRKTALSATNLNRIDLGLNVVDDRVIELNTIKAEKSIVNNLVKDISFTPETGVFQIVKQDGSTITYDTKLEKLAVNFTYDPLTQKLIIILDDGTKQEVDLSTLVADYEFVDTNTVGFTKQPDGKILANIKNGSITEEKLQPNYLSEIKQQVNSSTQNVIQSENFANQSKRWAIGIDEEPSSLTDNSKYYSEEAKRYAEQAESTVGFGIATTEKAGIVKPDGVTITVSEDGTISGANKVDIATSSTVGVVKPSQDLTIAPDGTLGINTLFSMIEERANIQSGDTWETVLAKINKNLGDLKPLAFLDKVTESYLDTLITNKINNAIQKSQIVNNTVTTVEGTVLDGRVGKNLQDQIIEQSNNLNNISRLTVSDSTTIADVKNFIINAFDKGIRAINIFQGNKIVIFNEIGNFNILVIKYNSNEITAIAVNHWNGNTYSIAFDKIADSFIVKDNNTKKHSREVIKSGTIYDFVSNKINEGYNGGEIEIVGVTHKPSDAYNGNEWGVVNWIKSASRIATLFFYPDRTTDYGYRNISPTESFDTGWITK